jgi:hypothetical protein
MSSAHIRNDIAHSVTPMRERVWFGYFIDAPADMASPASIIVPDYDPSIHWSNCRWQARDSFTLPQPGDECLVKFDNRNQPWIVAWWPGVVPSATYAPLASPVFTGDPQAPSPPTNDNDNSIPNTSWVNAALAARTPKITVSVWSGGPPASPASGDIWIATSVVSGMSWQFVYNAASTWANKWEFIGGPPFVTENSTDQTISNSTWTNLNTASFVTRAGCYIFQGMSSGAFTTVGSSTVELGVGKNGTNVAGIVLQSYPTTTSFDYNVGFEPWEIDGWANGDVATLQGWQNSAGYHFSNKSFSVIPKRIS